MRPDPVSAQLLGEHEGSWCSAIVPPLSPGDRVRRSGSVVSTLSPGSVIGATLPAKPGLLCWRSRMSGRPPRARSRQPSFLIRNFGLNGRSRQILGSSLRPQRTAGDRPFVPKMAEFYRAALGWPTGTSDWRTFDPGSKWPNVIGVEVFWWDRRKTTPLQPATSFSPNRRSHQVQRKPGAGDRFSPSTGHRGE